MNRIGAIVVFIGGLALTNANLYAGPAAADTAGGSDSPIAAPAAPSPQESTPPPKITLTGITTISGPAEVLYKVAGGNQDGKPCPDKSCILKEGEEQDGVEVVTIDVKKNEVTFSNHGVRQNISLANGVPVGGKPLANDVVKSPSSGSNPKPAYYTPKPGDFDYADQKTVTAPLPPSENPGSAVDAPSIYGGGIGGDTPPGHGGF